MLQQKKKYILDWKKLPEKEYLVHKKRIISLSWNCLGSRLVSSSSDHTARVGIFFLIFNFFSFGVCDKEDQTNHTNQKAIVIQLNALLGIHTILIFQVGTLQLQQKAILATCSNDKMLKVWDIRTYKTPIRVQNTKGGSLNLAWSPSGHLIGVGNRQNKLQFFDGKELTPRGDFYDGVTQINQFQWDVTGNVIFITTLTGQIFLLDGQNPVQENGGNQQIIEKLGGHTALCYTLAVDRTGNYIASGGPDALVCLWDARELYIQKTISQLDTQVRRLSFSYDGRFLAICSLDKCVVIYDINGIHVTDQQKGDEFVDGYFAGYHQPFKVHTIKAKNNIQIAQWSPNGYHLAFGGGEDKKDEGSIHLYGAF